MSTRSRWASSAGYGYDEYDYDVGYSDSTSSTVDIELEQADIEWHAKTYDLRVAIIHILLDERLHGRRVTPEQLITSLNVLGGATEGDNVYNVDTKLIRTALQSRGRKTFSIQLNHTGIATFSETEWADRVLYIRMGASRSRSNQATDFGVHNNTLQAEIDIERNTKPPVNIDRQFLEMANIPAEVKDRLKAYLKRKMTDKNSRDKSSSSGKKNRRRERKSKAVVIDEEAEAAKAEAEAELASLQKDYEELIKSKEVIVEQITNIRNTLKSKSAELKVKEGDDMDDSKKGGNDEAAMNEDTTDKTLLFIHKGRIGRLDLDDTGVVHEDELKAGLMDLPEDIDNEKSDTTRLRTNYASSIHGSSACWVPRSHGPQVKNRDAGKEEEHDIIKRIQDLFSGEISKWSPEAKRIIIACSMFGYGASDEALIMSMSGILKALFHEAGIPISNEQIGKALPSRALLYDMEVDCAADCLLARCQEMKDDNVRNAGLVSDHGHRAGFEHFVKLMTWAGMDEDGLWTIKFHLVDVDAAGHSAVQAATAIRVSTEMMLEILNDISDEDVKISVLTGDSGGGAAVHFLFEELLKIKFMDPEIAKMLSCDLHNFVKPLEVACADSWGRQGIGHKTPFQMIWLFVKMIKMVRNEYGRKGLNQMWGKIVSKLKNDTKWQETARALFPQSFEDFLGQLDALEEEDFDVAVDMANATDAPKNIQDPVFTRWGTVLAANTVFVNNWPVIYFFAESMKDEKKNGSHLWQVACALLSLMNNTDAADTDGESLEDFIGSFINEDDEPTVDLKPGQTPVFLAVLQFLDGFNRAYFEDMFNFLKKNDPFFGIGSFGQMARFGPERQYIMHKKLAEIEGDGWKSNKHFEKFRQSLKGVGDGKNGVKYFKKVTEVFFERFRYSFNKHMGKKWRSSKILHYILAGDPHHAREFARWLVDYKEGVSGETDGAVEDLPFMFTSQDDPLPLGMHHQTNPSDNTPITVDLRASMEYITSEASREEIINDSFVVEYWDEIKKLSEATKIVQLFAKKEDGTLDRSTWENDKEYESLFIALVTKICIHASHQQRCENYVQLAGLLSKTGVGEVRKSLRAIIIGTTIRPFNLWALPVKNKMNAAKKPPQPPVNRLQGSDKTFLFHEYLDGVFKRADRGKETLKSISSVGNGISYENVRKRLRDGTKKASAIEQEEKLKGWENTLERPSKKVKAQEPLGIHKTAYIQEAVQLSILTDTNSRYLPGDTKVDDVVMAEIKARKICKDLSGKKAGKRRLKSMSLKEKRDLLRRHEYQLRSSDELELKEKEVKYIEPQSNEMKKLLTDGIQQQIFDKKDEIDRIER